MPSRFDEYRCLLIEAIHNDYEVLPIQVFWDKIKENRIEPDHRYLILRHDVDTDLPRAKALWKLEHDLGIKSSYYFRLSTLDIHFMRQIAGFGCEASYHYEELATIAKRKRLRTRGEVLKELPAIRQLFEQNINHLRGESGLSFDVVASHGDFLNRELGIKNTEILSDSGFRKRMGVELEVYDGSFTSFVDSGHADAGYPLFWTPRHPLEAIRNGAHVVYILVHPRQWGANVPVNMWNDFFRCWESIHYKRFGTLLKTSPGARG